MAERNPEAIREEFEKLATPLIKFLNDYHNPHCIITITHLNAEVLSGEYQFRNEEFIKD